MKELLIKFAEYNFWANTQLAEFLQKISDEVLDKDQKSSFRSLRKTWLHIWDAELLWLSRLKSQKMNFWPSEQYNADNSIIGLLDVSKEWMSFLSSKDNSFFLQKCFYKSISGEEQNDEIYTIVNHCLNHSTFHRGQIITLLREAGIKEGIPSTDLITFSRKKKN
jgi:uncharacterized damage-inducible protein DinB